MASSPFKYPKGWTLIPQPPHPCNTLLSLGGSLSVRFPKSPYLAHLTLGLTPGGAGSASAPLAVSATVVRSCVIRALPSGSVEVGCVKGVAAVPVRSSAGAEQGYTGGVGGGAADSRGPVVREALSVDGASVLVTVDF